LRAGVTTPKKKKKEKNSVTPLSFWICPYNLYNHQFYWELVPNHKPKYTEFCDYGLILTSLCYTSNFAAEGTVTLPALEALMLEEPLTYCF
jgi:hypothetical protein